MRAEPSSTGGSAVSRQPSRGCGLDTRLRSEEGSNLLEYAIVVITFLTMIFGIAAFGHMYFAYHFVNEAAKEATRFAAVNGYTCNSDAAYSTNGNGSCMTPITCTGPGNCTTCSGSSCMAAAPGDITNFVEMITPSSIDFSKITVTPTWNPSGSPDAGMCGATDASSPTATNSIAGCTVEVQVTYDYSFIFPLIRSTPLPLSSTSQMVIAH
jgi:Flp pilus assembly protein TadG